MAELEGAHGLLQGLLEGAADGHDLADRLHACGEGLVGALELLKGKAGNLDDAVVDGGLEAGGRHAGDVVEDLVERVAHGEKRGGLGDGEARGLGGESGGTAHTGVHLDDDDAAVGGVDGELHVGAARGDADALQDCQRVVAQTLQLDVGQGLSRGDGDGIAGVHAHGVEVLDGADDDAVAGSVTHDLHLDLFPTLDGLLDEDLVGRRELQALRDDLAKACHVVGHAAAGAAQREGGADDDGEAQVSDDVLGIDHRVGEAGAGNLEVDVGHGLGEELAVLADLDGVDVAADGLDAVLVEDAGLAEGDGAVKRGLATHVGKQRVGALLGDDALHRLGRDGLDVGAVGRVGVGHDGGRVGVDQDDLVALLAKSTAGLGARIVELAGLADDDGARADNENLLNVSALRHLEAPPLANVDG